MTNQYLCLAQPPFWTTNLGRLGLPYNPGEQILRVITHPPPARPSSTSRPTIDLRPLIQVSLRWPSFFPCIVWLPLQFTCPACRLSFVSSSKSKNCLLTPTEHRSILSRGGDVSRLQALGSVHCAGFGLIRLMIYDRISVTKIKNKLIEWSIFISHPKRCTLKFRIGDKIERGSRREGVTLGS